MRSRLSFGQHFQPPQRETDRESNGRERRDDPACPMTLEGVGAASAPEARLETALLLERDAFHLTARRRITRERQGFLLADQEHSLQHRARLSAMSTSSLPVVTKRTSGTHHEQYTPCIPARCQPHYSWLEMSLFKCD